MGGNAIAKPDKLIDNPVESLKGLLGELARSQFHQLFIFPYPPSCSVCLILCRAVTLSAGPGTGMIMIYPQKGAVFYPQKTRLIYPQRTRINQDDDLGMSVVRGV